MSKPTFRTKLSELLNLYRDHKALLRDTVFNIEKLFAEKSPWTSVDELPSGITEQIYIFNIAINEDAVAYRCDMIMADGDEAANWIQRFNIKYANVEKIVEWNCQPPPKDRT